MNPWLWSTLCAAVLYLVALWLSMARYRWRLAYLRAKDEAKMAYWCPASRYSFEVACDSIEEQSKI